MPAEGVMTEPTGYVFLRQTGSVCIGLMMQMDFCLSVRAEGGRDMSVILLIIHIFARLLRLEKTAARCDS